MTSIAPNETAHVHPWGTSLAMAGAMAAGMATGRRNKLALIAGVAVVVGIKWMLRRSATRCVGPLKITKVQEPELRDEVRTVSVASSPRVSVVDEAMPVVWEQGRNEPMSCGAIEGQTVWFEMPAIPVLPVLKEASELPASFFCENPNVGLAPLPNVPAITEDAAPGMMLAYMKMDPSGESGELSFFDPLPLLEKNPGLSEHGVSESAEMKQIMDEMHRGPHRSVVPQAPINDGRSGRMMMLAVAVVLVITAIAMVMGFIRQDGGAEAAKRHSRVADGSGKDSPADGKGAWATPKFLEK